MTGMMRPAHAKDVARLFTAPPLFDSVERMAAELGIADARRFGARARLFLRNHPRLLTLFTRLFGFGVENGLANERLESIRLFALAETLGHRDISTAELLRRWTVT